MTNFRTSVINLDRPGDPSVFPEQTRIDAAELISRYPAGQERSALLPLLHLVQAEQGYVSPDGIAFCADTLNLTKAQVAAVSTFYTMYKRTPTGEYLVSICTNTLCGLMGGDEIFESVKDTLGIANNATTADGKITIEHAECLAACDYAPVVTVNYEFFDNLTVESTNELIGKLQAGERPAPTRGAPLCSFKQIERQIAGIFDEPDLYLEAPGTGAPTEAGVKLAVERGESAPSYAIERAGESSLSQGERLSVEGSEAADHAIESDQPTKDDQAAEKVVAGKTEGPSDNDAPLKTAESDTANSTKPASKTQKGD